MGETTTIPSFSHLFFSASVFPIDLTFGGMIESRCNASLPARTSICFCACIFTGKPKPIINQIGIVGRYDVLKTQGIFCHNHPLERLVCCMQYNRSRGFVYFSGFNTYKSVLQMVNPANTMLSSPRIQRIDKGYPIHLLVVDSHRNASFKLNLQIFWCIRCFFCIFCPFINFLWRLSPGVFQYAALDTSTPEVLIRTIRTLYLCLYRNIVLFGIPDLFIARHLPFTYRGNNL